MQSFLFGAYHAFGVALYLLLSTVLLYRRLFRRWVRFSLGFFLVYVVGAYAFFGRVPLPFLSEAQGLLGTFVCLLRGMRGSHDAGAWIALASMLAALLGLPLVVGHALLNRRSVTQTAGAVLVFVVGMVAVGALVEVSVGYDRLQRVLVRSGCFHRYPTANTACFTSFPQEEREGSKEEETRGAMLGAGAKRGRW